jgi:hypothetical protein
MTRPAAITSTAEGPTLRRSTALRWAGWSGLAMLSVIILNGPLGAIRGLPEVWGQDAVTAVGSYLTDAGFLRLAVIFFFLSTLIFVFGIPFFAGLRELTKVNGAPNLASGAVTIGAALFLGGGLLSEVMSTGMAMVVQAAPSYTLDANAALATQSLQFAALIQGQVGLGVVMIAVSLAARSQGFGVPGLVALGLFAGVIDLLRPLAVTVPPLAIVLFLPTFVWIALASATLMRTPRSIAEVAAGA